LPMGSISSPHPRSIFRSVLERLFYTFVCLWWNKSSNPCAVRSRAGWRKE